ncbi:hypothetical protein ACFYZ3_00185 [Streptomyces sp. NPDC001599]|uniref:hypothetical protein n=1 Tax=Streptomyces sp. NPDC001599 TaxID=3364591 RepID=UPI0036CB1E08
MPQASYNGFVGNGSDQMITFSLDMEWDGGSDWDSAEAAITQAFKTVGETYIGGPAAIVNMQKVVRVTTDVTPAP